MPVDASQNWKANLGKAATAPRKSGTAHFNPLPSLALSPDGVYDIQYLEKRLRVAWRATKNSPFFIRLRFPRSHLRHINDVVSDGVISGSARKQNLTGPRVPIVPKIKGLLPLDLKAFLVLQLSLVPLGCPVEFALDEMERAGSPMSKYDRAKCYVIRDLVAIANGMAATSEYPKDWLEPQDTKVTKRKAWADIGEASKRARTYNMNAGTEMANENPYKFHEQNGGETASEGDANTGTDTECDSVSDTSSEESVESVKSELNVQDAQVQYMYDILTQPRKFQLAHRIQAAYSRDERKKVIEGYLNITEKPTDADLQAKMPPKPVLTGGQSDDILLRTYDFHRKQIEQEHNQAVMTHDERVRTAAVVRRVYQRLDRSVCDIDWNCLQIEYNKNSMRDDMATMRKEIMTLRSENVGFRAEIQLLKAATKSSTL